MSDVLVAKTNAMIEYDGRRIVVKKGITTAHADHDVVRTHPDLWEPQKINFATAAKPVEPVKDSAPVEAATAAPGERRTVTTPKSSGPTRRGRRTSKEGDGE